ncbi:GrpB family protein [Mycolicibacterium houstonense]|uniref:GrpB family protein n=1 Tax=Mycolicibacterium houstonense TaxID=146021 RepID=UPI003F949ED0
MAAVLRQSHRGQAQRTPALHDTEQSAVAPTARVRDALCANPILVALYAVLKRARASKHADDREDYSTAKADLVESVLNCRQ